MRRLAQLVARSSGWLSRRLGRGGGTTLPGVVLLKLRPRAAEELAAPLSAGSVVISATNGKTTTARLVRSATDAAGMPTVANTAGSNLLRGVTAALLDMDDDAQLGLFEVDEAALPSVVDQVQPRVIVLMNLFRDQLDRYGELETLVETWRTMIADLSPETTLVLNADDPAVAHLGHDRPNTVWFGVDDPSIGRAEQSHAADSTHCPRCDHPLTYDLIGIGHMGHWRCENCGLARPTPAVTATGVTVRGVDGFDIEISTPSGPVAASVALPGLHNAYNATAAVSAAHALGLDMALLPAALADTDAAFGRGEHVDIGDNRLVMLLAKNPTGANENVRATLTHTADLHVVIFLNDRTADGQDVSWIWDVDYEPLFDRVSSLTVSGDRAHDLALRCVYGGADPSAIVVEPDPGAALDAALASAGPGDTVFALPTYTAMLDLRAELVRRNLVVPFWEDA
ncbi:MAG: MurT ligase domain-containing protein [Actinomycetota bacterium]